MTAMLMLLAPVKRLTEVNAPLQRGLTAAENIFGLLDQIPEEDRGQKILPTTQSHARTHSGSRRLPAAAPAAGSPRRRRRRLIRH